nr:EAL domain-containing protein [Halochromatium glycolicum]
MGLRSAEIVAQRAQCVAQRHDHPAFATRSEEHLESEDVDHTEHPRDRLKATIAAANQAIPFEPAEHRLLEALCETLVRGAEIVLAWVALPSASGRLESAAAAGRTDCLDELVLAPHGEPSLAQGPHLLAYRSGQTYLDNDVLDSAPADPWAEPWQERARASGVAAAIALPLRSSEGVLGTLNLCAAVADLFGQDEVLLLEVTANALGLALEARRNAAVLIESQGRYRQIFEQSPLGIVHYDADGTIVDCNAVYLRVLGADREQLIGANLIHDIDDQRVVDAVRRSLTQGQGHLDIVYRSAAWNQFLPVRAVFTGVRDGSGRIVAGIGLLEDFTERREIAARLHENEQRLRLAVDAARIGIWELDLEQGTLHWDGWMRRLHGLNGDAMLTSVREWRERIVPDDRFRATRALLSAARSDQPRSARLRIVLPNDEYRYLQLHACRFRDGNGQRPRVTGVCYDVTEQHLASARIEQLALFDELTGLSNRRLLMDRLSQAIRLTQRQHSYRALLLLDLDGFKRANDTRGHAVGDRLLIAFADRLRHALRRTDTAARLGGDEFVVLCGGLSASAEDATQEAARIASKLVEMAAEPYWLSGADEVPLYCSVSIGITLFNDESCSADELMKQADIAMYESKRTGRDTWRFFETSMQRAIEQQEAKTQALRQALHEDRLVLRYLPQVDQEGQWCGYEALVRWNASGHELRRPDEFLKLAESSGLIQAIDDWVLQRACRDFADLTAHQPPSYLHLGVNVSIRQLLDTEFAERVMQTVLEAGLQPHHLRLEVTEQALFVDVEQAQAAIERLLSHGIAIVLDDFGTGSSSLLQLQRLSLQAVKIDQGLVRGIENSPTKVAIVRAAISAAKALSLAVIAEGVENEEQFQLLRAEGCSVFQGYYFAEPMPVEALSQHLSAPG